jgi:two-component system LytT family response regulator
MTAHTLDPERLALKAYLVDDEPLAVRRLSRLLEATRRVEIVGSSSDPEAALAFLGANAVDVLFLDIEMPGMNGFELLARLERQPLVVFTTAYDRYALRAFEVNSIDYLLKPIEPQQLERALDKLDRLAGGRQEWATRPDIRGLLEEISRSLRSAQTGFLTRVASRLGERIQFVDVREVTHFFARDKLTYAAAGGRQLCLDRSIADLESRLDPQRFVRIHRSTLVNLDWVQEVAAGLGGGALLRLKDERRTELVVARDRARTLKERLGL